jgi:predicted phosphoribosyltransferase
LIFSKVFNFLSLIKDGSFVRFNDRETAADSLTKLLKNHVRDFSSKDILVLGIPRGGVVMADIIARKLNANFDIIVTRKLRAPQNKELALGAILYDKKNKSIMTYLEHEIIRSLNIPSEYLEEERTLQMQEISRRISLYTSDSKNNIDANDVSLDIENKVVILVDDGAYTGSTVIVTARWLKGKKPKKLIIALTVAPKETIKILEDEVDVIEVMITSPIRNFKTVSRFYHNFLPVSDEKIIEIMKRGRK